MAPTTQFLLFLPILLILSTVKSSNSVVLDRLISELGLKASVDPCDLPGVSCDGSSAVRISLPSTRLTGFISPVIGQLPTLGELSLPDNQLTGGIPPELASCHRLRVLDLRRNRLSGPIPAIFSSLSSSLRILDIADNSLTGDLSFLAAFTNLERLSVGNNLFTGRAPNSLATPSPRRPLPFDISDNSYRQTTAHRHHHHRPLLPSVPAAKPRRTPSLSKRYILAENTNRTNLNSTITSNSNRTRTNSTSQTNSTAQTNTTDTALESHLRHLRHKHKIRNWILGFIAGSIAGIMSGLLLSILFRFTVNCINGRFKNPGGPSIFSPQLIRRAEDLAFLENDEELSSLEIVGRGGCGEVYKKELPPSPKHPDRPGTVIAIKKILKRTTESAEPTSEEESRLLDKWMRQIRSEIQTVGHIRHRNLLPLLAHVTRPTCHYLVYEYMKNGSLEAALKGAADGTRNLDWITRFEIAIGISNGLTYLHHHHKPQIIHRDLKPANILLDDDMEPRIADFGLAKEMPDAHTHITSSNVAGTWGYIAPEYHQTLKYTAKCDMYSFGVILAALVIGKLPSDEFFQNTEEYSLVKWLRNVLKSDKPHVAIDPKLKGNGYEEQMLLVLKIACFCTIEDPKERPDSKDVRVMLNQIKHEI